MSSIDMASANGRSMADIQAPRSIKDATKALQAQFSAAKIPLTLPAESRRILQSFIDEHDDTFSDEESTKINQELRNFWERYVGEHPAKTGAFVGVLRELRPAITHHADIVEWWRQVVKQIITTTGYRKVAVEDAVELLVGWMQFDPDEAANGERAKTSRRLRSELQGVYLAKTRNLTNEDDLIAPDNAQVAQQIENVLIAFGRKQPKEFFLGVTDLVAAAGTRLQGLTLLTSFLRHQTPHLYLVADTTLIEHLLKCLINDTSTTILSVALTSLIMLLPHIPGSLPQHLPRLFLVYSRLLCWEKFSPLSSEAQRSLVTDDRLASEDHGDVGIDARWEKARPKEGAIESSTPELLTYFTHLYGLYPLNFMSYIRKPRRYLRNINFPGADDFDLDLTVIRQRSDQFRQVHLLHPNFYNLTIEEELIDPKWPKAEAADVVAECQALCVNAKPSLASPGPPPSSRLPDVPAFPALATMRNHSPQVSPSTSHASFKTGNSWRDTQSTAVSAHAPEGESPVLRPHSDDESAVPALRPRSKASKRTSPSIDDFPQPGSARRGKDESPPQTNVEFLQRENTVLRNELNFERWHKAQYSAHIGQLMRKNVKDATSEAEMLNLINANRTMKMQLDQVRNAREATIKDSALTRKQANNLEANLTERFTQMRKEQETWRADAQELRRLREENRQYRDLLVAVESRELNKTQQLELVKRDLECMEELQRRLDAAERKIREYEYREFEMQQAKREMEILYHEKETLQMRVKRHQHDAERARRAYADKISELEAQLEQQQSEPNCRRPQPTVGPDTQVLIQQAISDSQTKLNQLRKKHTALMEKYTDLEMEYESVKEQLDAMQGQRNGYHRSDPENEDYSLSGSDNAMSGALGPKSTATGYDATNDITALSDNAFISSASDPSSRRYQPQIPAMPASPPPSEPALHGHAGLTWKPPVSRKDSLGSRGSSQRGVTFNQTAPLRDSELQPAGSGHLAFSATSDEGKSKKKITPDSQVRVYGRGEPQHPDLGTENMLTSAQAGLKTSK